MRWFVILFCMFLLGCTSVGEEIAQTPSKEQPQIQSTKGDTMKLTSSAFKHNSLIQARYTCDGEDKIPPLAWDEVPEGTKSFALIVDDPDAPNGLWIHWLVKNIPPDKRNIAEDEVPGDEVDNSWNRKEWGGPCPPSGTHRYFFKLYALDVEKLDADNAKDFYKQVEEHKIEEAILMGKYSRG